MNLDDPKFTAYALGELTDSEDVSEIEAWLSTNPEARAFVTDTQELAAFLSKNLHSSANGLTDDQRSAILDHARIIPLPTTRRSWSIVALTALAACLAAAPLLPWADLLRLRNSATPTMAINDSTMTIQMPLEKPVTDNGPEARPGDSPLAPPAALRTDRILPWNPMNLPRLFEQKDTRDSPSRKTLKSK